MTIRCLQRPKDNLLLKGRLLPQRARILLFCLGIFFVILIGRAFYLQIILDDFLQSRGDLRSAQWIDIEAYRGKIFDRKGQLLAVSVPAKSIWIVPKELRGDLDGKGGATRAQLDVLAEHLGLTWATLQQKMAEEKHFVYLKRHVDLEVANVLLAQKIPGVYWQDELLRRYPMAHSAAHVVGFVDVDGVGQEGVELAHNQSLSGVNGKRRVLQDRKGRIVDDVEALRAPMRGENLTLSIDSSLQYLTHRYLKEALDRHQARSASAVVLDVTSGEVLAMANVPSYDPQDRSSMQFLHMRNLAIVDVFEPGSILKPFIIGLALQTGKVNQDTVINCEPGSLRFGRFVVSDVHPHSELTVSDIIQKSSNIGTAKIGLMLSPKQIWSLFDMLGFGKPLQLSFPGKASGRLRPWQSWRPVEQATMSYGHGISASLLQIAAAYLVIARDGDFIQPTFLKRDDVIVGLPVFSPQVTRSIRQMLRRVTLPGGTAQVAQVPAYQIGGKTGTARKIENGRYVKKYMSSFVGIAPLSKPRIVVVVVVDEPSNGQYFAGEVAAPIFREIVAGALHALEISPDHLEGEVVLQH